LGLIQSLVKSKKLGLCPTDPNPKSKIQNPKSKIPLRARKNSSFYILTAEGVLEGAYDISPTFACS
jgi:hypothetical protein